MDINNRVKRLRELMKAKRITAYIVPTSDPHQSEYLADYYKGRAWISGFTGSAGTVVITQDDANLWTDGRYFIQAENQLQGSEYKLFKMGVPGVPNYIEWLKDNLEAGASIGFDGKVFSQSDVERLEEEFEGKDVEFEDEYDLIGRFGKIDPDYLKEKHLSMSLSIQELRQGKDCWAKKLYGG